jgi:phosphoribosylaminoimidazole-succinocarboxamide synthase
MTALAGLGLFARGKVRDLYEVEDDRLLIVATDRISAFDVVLPTPIPDKGKVLNQLSTFWFGRTAGIVPNHLLTADVGTYPTELRGYGEVLAGRSMLVRRTRRIDVECVARGYLAGTAWSEYRRLGTACGLALPAGLEESQALPEPIFTPAIKAASGHDENIPYARLVELVGEDLAARLRGATLAVYEAAARYAAGRGIIIADTKLEFGLLPDGSLLLIDELLTPDSSRFWEAATYRPGTSPPSYDKQYVRDYLEGSGWDKEPPAPPLPPEVVAQTRRRYVDALRRLTDQELA